MAKFSLFELGQLSVRVSQHSVQDLAPLAKLGEASLSPHNVAVRQALAVLDKGLLHNCNEFVGAAADVGDAVDERRHLLEREEAVEALINELLVDSLPKLVVLKSHH